MDYNALAKEFFHSIRMTGKGPFQKKVEDVSHGERRILGFLMEDNGVTAGELSEKLCLTTPRVASTLNSLSKKNFIERHRDVSDKRVVIVKITDIGKTFMEAEFEKAMEIMIKTFEQLGEHDSMEFVRIMKRIHEIHQSNEMQ